MIIDPRAPVHATTGILPVGELAVPADQYSGILAQLKVNFITRPILEMANGLVIPLPEESGYNWSWIAPGKTGSPLKASAANEYPIYGYTPQSIQEGWVQLNPEPTEKNTSEDQE
jgi:hypothetical protein